MIPREPTATALGTTTSQVSVGAPPVSRRPALSDARAPAMARPQRTLWGEAWRRFRRHRLGMMGMLVLIAFVVLGVGAPVFAPYAQEAQDLSNQFAGPSTSHWLGTDELGRDIFSRLLFAARITLFVTAVSTLLATVIGVLVGAAAGFFGGWTETILMRFTDVMLSLPELVLLLIVSKMLRDMAFLRNTFGTNNVSVAVIVIILTLFGWMALARLVHGSVLSLKQRDFVEAARTLGARPWRIIGQHLLPNSVAPIIVRTTLRFGTAVIIEGTLSFLGLGISPPNASLGNMLTGAQGVMFRNPMLAVYPGMVIFFVVLAINFVGDALRDALDPRMSL
jgi:peptide/nickel transport system permease protein